MSLRAIGRLRAGGGAAAAVWTPADLFPAAGLWLDQSDSATGFTDSAGTTPAVVNDPIGRRSDKSGNALHLLQATSAARPQLKLNGAIYSDLMDGVDDGNATAGFAAGTLTADMDCFIAIKRTGALGLTISSADLRWFGYFVDGGGSLSHEQVGAALTTYVDGVLVGDSTLTNAQLAVALTANVWHILEIRNLDLSAWTDFRISAYTGFGQLAGNIGGVVLCTARDDATRTLIRNDLQEKVGL